MILSVDELVSDVTKLVSLPEVCLKVISMVENPETSIDEIGKVISQDPGLTVKILRISNSAMYGLRNEVDTVSRAITYLGTRQIRDLVLATSAFDTFRGISNSLVTMEDFWSHSLRCGLAANQLTKLCGLRNADGLFVAGLLHDIGQLILFNRQPELSQQAIILSMEGSEELEMHEAEQSLMGFNHMDVGFKLAEEWNLPEYLRCCIGYHHKPSESPDFKQEVSIIHIANTIAVLSELNSDDPDLAPVVDDYAWQQTGLDASIYAAVIDNIGQEYDEVESLLNF
ncbi:MAG: HDOD domain-containing protein [Gammaproteobacteria bacterium]|nr:HDOD domain-containing protein [Gammaproteobacteria bacterium]